MKKFLSVFSGNQGTPFLEIFMFRNDPSTIPANLNEDFSENQQIFDLPIIPKALLSIFTESFKKDNDLLSSLKLFEDLLIFDPQILTMIHNSFSKSRSIPESDLVRFFYCSLSWIIAKKEIQTRETLLIVLSCINLVVATSFRQHLRSIFLLVCEVAFSHNEYVWDTDLISGFMQQLLFDDEYTPASFWIIRSLYLSTSNSKIYYYPVLSMIDNMIRERRMIVSSQEAIYFIIEHITGLFYDFDPMAISIFVGISMQYPEIVKSHFSCLPSKLIEKITSYSITIHKEDIQCQPTVSCSLKDIEQETFCLPKQDIIFVEDENMTMICPPSFRYSLVQIQVSLCQIQSCIRDDIVQCLIERISDIIESEWYVDLLIVILGLFKVMFVKSQIEEFITLIQSDIIFSPSQTVFSPSGMNFVLKILRNEIFDILYSIDTIYVSKMIQQSAQHPLLFAEHLARIMFRYPMLDYQFIVENSLTMSLISNLLILPQFQSKVCIYARSVLLKFLFGILGDQSLSINCFKSKLFSSGVLSLLFEPEISDLMIECITKSISQFLSIPDEVVLFLSDVLVASNEKIGPIARRFSQGLILRIAQSNIRIESFVPILDISLKFLEINPSSEMLYNIISFISHVFQMDNSLILDKNHFYLMNKMILHIEGEEPSEHLQTKLLFIMSRSTNLSNSSIFMINIYSILPIYICSFSKSKKIPSILQHLIDLCKISEFNSISCFKGDVPLLLLKSLSGPFVYNGRIISFLTNDDIIDKIFKLVSLIVSVQSNYQIDLAFFANLLPTKEGIFPPFVIQAFSSLNTVFIQSKQIPTPSYPIAHVLPIVTTSCLGSENINNGFIISFWAKTDLLYSTSTPNPYHFFKLTDESKNSIDVFFYRDSILVQIDFNNTRTSSSVFKNLKSNNWSFYVIMMSLSSTSFFLHSSVDHVFQDQIEYKLFKFSGRINCCIGFSSRITPSNDYCPVYLGPYAMFTSPLSEDQYYLLSSNGIDSIKCFPNLLFSSESLSLIFEKDLHRNRYSIVETICEHTSISLFYPVFANLSNSPPNVAELAIVALMNTLDISKRKKTSSLDRQIPISINTNCFNSNEYFTYLTGVDSCIFKEIGVKWDNFKSVPMHLNDVSGVVYLIIHESKTKPSYSLYSAFFAFMKSAQISSMKEEIFENIVFNLWIWCGCDEYSQKRIFSNWLNIVTQIQMTHSIEYSSFSSFLVQSHMISNFSKKILPLLENNKFRIIEELIKHGLNDDEMCLLVSVIIHTNPIHEILKYIQTILKIPQEFIKLNESHGLELLELCEREEKDQVLFALFELFLFVFPSNNRFFISQLCLRIFKDKCQYQLPNCPDVHFIYSLYHPSYKIQTNILKIHEVTPFWYFWPVLSAVFSDINQVETINYLVDLLLVSSTPDSDLRKIFFVTSIVEALNFQKSRELKFEIICRVLFRALSDPVLLSKIEVRRLFLICFFFTFYEIGMQTHSSSLLSLLTKEPFFCNPIINFPPNQHTFDQSEIERALKLFKTNKSFYVYRLRIDPSIPFLNVLTHLFAISRTFDDPLLANFQNFLSRQSHGLQIQIYDSLIFDNYSDYVISCSQEFMQLSIELLTFVSFPKRHQTFLNEMYTNCIAIERMRFHQLFHYGEKRSQTVLSQSNESKFFISSVILNPLIQFFKRRSSMIDGKDYILESILTVFEFRFHQYPAVFELWKSKFRLIREGQFPVIIPYHFISLILVSDDGRFEIYTDHCNSILLHLDEDVINIFYKTCKQMQIPISYRNDKLISKVLDKWKNNQITAFDMILSVNFIMGRSFQSLSLYPFFPTIIDNSISMNHDTDYVFYSNFVSEWHNDQTDLELAKQISSIIERGSYFVPEMFCCVQGSDRKVCDLPNNISSLSEYQYNNRKLIESSSYYNAVTKWVQIVTGNKSIIDTTKIVKSNRQSNLNVGFCDCLGAFIDFPYFVIIQRASLVIGKYMFDDGKLIVIDISVFQIEPTKVMVFAKKSLFIINTSALCLYYIQHGNHPISKHCTLNITHICESGNWIYYVVNGNIIRTSHKKLFPNNSYSIALAKDTITIFECSKKNDIISYFTVSNVLVFISLTTGMVLYEQQMPKQIDHLKIAKNYSFVIAQMQQSIIAHNSKGTKLYEYKIPQNMNLFDTFSKNGEEIIVYSNPSGFSIAPLHDIQAIHSFKCGKIIACSYNEEIDVFVAIDDSSNIITI